MSQTSPAENHFTNAYMYTHFTGSGVLLWSDSITFLKCLLPPLAVSHWWKGKAPEILTNGGKRHKKSHRIAIELLRDSIPEVVVLIWWAYGCRFGFLLGRLYPDKNGMQKCLCTRSRRSLKIPMWRNCCATRKPAPCRLLYRLCCFVMSNTISQHMHNNTGDLGLIKELPDLVPKKCSCCSTQWAAIH